VGTKTTIPQVSLNPWYFPSFGLDETHDEKITIIITLEKFTGTERYKKWKKVKITKEQINGQK
jgi:hypothetical protein